MAIQMKDSGVAWIGMMPDGWRIEKGKHVLVYLERPIKDTDSVVTCFRDGQVTLRSNRRELGFTVSLQEIGYKGVEPGDLVVHGMDGFAGSIGISDSRGKCSPVLNILDSEEDKTFLMYYLRMMAYGNVFLALSTGIRERTCDTNWNKLKELPYPVPGRDVQNMIASTLTFKCAEIDKVVEQTRATIEEYKKLKQAIITEAVTKGVRGPRPMKPSGVEWIGDIPEEWSKDKIGRVCNLIGSGTTPKFDRFDLSSADIPWIQSGDLSSAHLHNVKTYVTRDIIAAHSALKVYEPPFIAVAMYGASIGNTSISSFSACVNQACCVLTPNTFNLSYLYYIIMACKPYFMYQGEGGGQPNISQEKIKQTWIPVPNPIEQQEIATYLDAKCAEIDRIIEKKEQLIEELGSYKKSLIYEYVTGKKEVTA